MADLLVDNERAHMAEETGIYVRAKHGGSWGSHDIATLTPESLREWLRSRGGENKWAEDVVLILLGYSEIGSSGENKHG